MNNDAILDQSIAALQAETGLQVQRVTHQTASDATRSAPFPDVWLDISMPGAPDVPTVRFVAEIKSVDRFQTLNALHARARHGPEPLLLVAPFITTEAAQQCRSLGLNYIDASGNASIRVPGYVVHITGKPRREPARPARRFKALTPAGLRIVFALLTRPGLLAAPYREIATAAGVALGSVGDVLADLQARGHLTVTEPRRLLAPETLREEWATHFPVKLRTQLHPRHFTATPGWWKGEDLRPLQAAWGGEVAAHHLTGYLEPQQITIYTPSAPDALVLKYRLRPDPEGEIEILNTFWPLTADGTTDSATVPPLLVYADLLASNDPRNIDTAQSIRTQYLDIHCDAADRP